MIDTPTIKDINYVFKKDNSVVEFVKGRLEEIQEEYVGVINTRLSREKVRESILRMMKEVCERYTCKAMPDHLRVEEKDGIMQVDMSECFTNIFMYETYNRLMKENNVLRARVRELEEYEWMYKELQK